MNKVLLFLILFTVVFMSGCGTVFTGTTSKVQVNSRPSGAKVQVDGVDCGETPIQLDLKRKRQGQTITLALHGREQIAFQAKTSFNYVSILNLYNIIGWGIDAASGSMWVYKPDCYNIQLESDQDRVAREKEEKKLWDSLTPAQKLDFSMRQQALNNQKVLIAQQQSNMEYQVAAERRARMAAVFAGVGNGISNSMRDYQNNMQNQQMINAYQDRTRSWSKPVDVNLNGNINHTINKPFYGY